MSENSKFSFLVYEKNAKSDVFEAELVVKMLEDQKVKLKNWVEQLLNTQEMLIRKVEKYKNQLNQELRTRMNLEQYLREIQESSKGFSGDGVVYSIESHEEVVMNTSKLIKKVQGNEPICEIFTEKISPDSLFYLVKEFHLDQAYIKLVQVLCEIINCTSLIPSN